MQYDSYAVGQRPHGGSQQLMRWLFKKDRIPAKVEWMHLLPAIFLIFSNAI